MNKLLHNKWTDIWNEIVSPTIFWLDIFDSFKYRKTQTWLSLFATLAIFLLIGWFISADVSDLNWSGNRVIWLALFYLPLLIMPLFWFRACSTYDITLGRTDAKGRLLTKRYVQAAVVFRLSMFVFGFYYCYCMFRLWQMSH